MPRKKAGVKKMDSIREALQQLGKKAMPLDIQNAVMDKHGIELSTSLISNYKSYLRTKRKKRTLAGRAATQPVTAANARAGGIRMDDILAVKALTDRIGADKVADLAKV